MRGGGRGYLARHLPLAADFSSGASMWNMTKRLEGCLYLQINHAGTGVVLSNLYVYVFQEIV